MEKMSNSRREPCASYPSAWLLQQAGNLEFCLSQGWIPPALQQNLPGQRAGALGAAGCRMVLLRLLHRTGSPALAPAAAACRALAAALPWAPWCLGHASCQGQPMGAPHRPAVPPSTKPGRCRTSRWLLPSRGGEVAGLSLCCSTSNILMKHLPKTNPAANGLLEPPLTETVMKWLGGRSEDVRLPPLLIRISASRGSDLLGTTAALAAE